MSEEPLVPVEEPAAETYQTGGRRRKRRGLPGCIAVLVALAIVVGGGYIAVSRGLQWVEDRFADPEDYAGPGTGKVTVEVAEGDTSTVICRSLKDEDVVASVDACIAAANADPDAAGIQVGFYQLKKQMAAADAIDVLVDPSNIVTNSVTIPEGLRVVDIVDILADETDFGAAQFEKVLSSPKKLGLPAYADGNPEGYLFPSTYAFGPKDKPADMLRAMVERWEQAAADVDLEARAEALGFTPHEMMTIASLVEAEGRGDDMPKIARVIYNRLEGDETNGLLQIDATVNYAANQELGAVPTTEDLELDSPYNTYKNPGLPPGPIEAPGEEAMQAAVQPAEGGWYYYVTVNLATGETKFAETYDEFLTYKNELREYCANESEGAC
ncbi:endolytic transglycosylase MltG [Nocardioides sp. GCM10027113]|uniref:endolytic transglycosylase MltG n=1 Tax=unclassified Nocardioides TaxID=2615069 RepID=UPI00361F7C5F